MTRLPPLTARAPTLLLDVDGVLSLFGFDPRARPAGTFAAVDGVVHLLAAGSGARLRRLAGRFELVWCTGWEERANEHLPHLLDLPGPLPFLRFDAIASPAGAHWKLAAIDAHVASGQAVAWIDDAHDERCRTWAASRRAPTLLVGTEPAVGLTDREVELLLGWAATLTPPPSEPIS